MEELSAAVLLQRILDDALMRRSTDVHLHAGQDELIVQFRVGGQLQPYLRLGQQAGVVVRRVKALAKMDVAESRVPQDGAFTWESEFAKCDVRVAAIPTRGGEALVLRLLPQTQSSVSFEMLGMTSDQAAQVRKLLTQPSGMVLVAGATGSGKTTTLYAMMLQLARSGRHVVSIEDPVERPLAGCQQIEVRERFGITFDAGLRALLRHDPDVIMVGEIRDRETADIAIRAALTGHFVYSTLHTNDAPSAITRLTDMGVENYLISSSLVAVLAQRLVRVLCPRCKVEDEPRMTPQGETIRTWRGLGCEHCFGTGYSGRVGIFELMEMNDEIRKLIMRNADAAEIAAAARRQGMRTLREDGWEKVRAGLTTAEEVLRVTQEF
ncbi:MAG: GspE/PulE family protein [Alicyclobacillus sp.]|nr:GspE/PulE family protein [Alicyclobacillus sp.]